jgi:hypothetical protein
MRNVQFATSMLKPAGQRFQARSSKRFNAYLLLVFCEAVGCTTLHLTV